MPLLTGGITVIAIDSAGLRDYVRINPRTRTLDGFLEILVESGFIDQEITERCELEGTLTRSANIQVSLSAKTVENSKFCNEASERLAAAINNPSSRPKPEVLQFASAAVAAPTATAIRGEVSGSTQATLSPYFVLHLLLIVALNLLH